MLLISDRLYTSVYDHIILALIYCCWFCCVALEACMRLVLLEVFKRCPQLGTWQSLATLTTAWEYVGAVVNIFYSTVQILHNYFWQLIYTTVNNTVRTTVNNSHRPWIKQFLELTYKSNFFIFDQVYRKKYKYL